MKKSLIYLCATILCSMGKPGIAMENHFNTKNKPHTLLAALYKKEQQQNRSIADFVIPEDKKLVGPLAAAYTKEKKQQKNGNFGKRESIQQFINQSITKPTFDNFEKSIQLADGKYGIFNDLEINQFQLFKDFSADLDISINHFDLSKSGISKKTFHKLLEISKTSAYKRENLLRQCTSDEIEDLFKACLYLGPDEEFTKLCAEVVLVKCDDTELKDRAEFELQPTDLKRLLFLSKYEDKRRKIFDNALKSGSLDLSSCDLCFCNGIENLAKAVDAPSITEINFDNNELDEIPFKKLKKLFPNLVQVSACNNRLSTCSMNDVLLFEKLNLKDNPITTVQNISLLEMYLYNYGLKKLCKKSKVSLNFNWTSSGWLSSLYPSHIFDRYMYCLGYKGLVEDIMKILSFPAELKIFSCCQPVIAGVLIMMTLNPLRPLGIILEALPTFVISELIHALNKLCAKHRQYDIISFDLQNGKFILANGNSYQLEIETKDESNAE